MTAAITGKKIVVLPIDELIPYARNSRTHNDAQVAQIAASIKEWGFTNPILIDASNGIIAGHGRLLAARQLQLSEVPTICCDGWTEAQKRAYVIADNNLALNSGWDWELLRCELEELEASGFDIDIVGFDAANISSIFLDREDGKTDADEEWQNMPEYNSEDKTAYKSVVVHFACQAHVEEFEKLVEQSLTNRYLWFPNIVIERVDDKCYN